MKRLVARGHLAEPRHRTQGKRRPQRGEPAQGPLHRSSRRGLCLSLLSDLPRAEHGSPGPYEDRHPRTLLSSGSEASHPGGGCVERRQEPLCGGHIKMLGPRDEGVAVTPRGRLQAGPAQGPRERTRQGGQEGLAHLEAGPAFSGCEAPPSGRSAVFRGHWRPGGQSAGRTPSPPEARPQPATG